MKLHFEALVRGNFRCGRMFDPRACDALYGEYCYALFPLMTV